MVGVPLQLSVAVTLPGFGGGTCDAHWTVTGPGQVSIGTMLSNTVISCVQVAELPHASVALYVRVTKNLFTQVELVVMSLTNVTEGTPVQLSLALTLAGFGAGICEAHCTVTPIGQVSVGGVPSNTVMICVQVAVIRQASVAL